MGIVTVPTFGADPVTITGPTLDAKVDGLATEFNGNIDDANIDSSAAIANSKLNLASISQNITHSGTMTHSGTVTMTAKDISEAKGADVASATTTTIWVTDGNFIHITGTTTITSFGTAGQAGDERTIVFDGILTLTHNSTSLILPGAANITTAAGDRAIVRAETTANARVISYVKASGQAVVATSPSVASQANMEAATDNTVMVTPLAVNWHPGVAKAWVNFDGTTTGTHAPTSGYNITEVTRNGTGDYTIVFATDFSSANYALMGMGKLDTGGDCIISISNLLAGSAQVICADDGGTVHDCTVVTFTFFGDQ